MNNEEHFKQQGAPAEGAAHDSTPTKPDAPVPAPKPPRRTAEEPVRRVGTLTMGFALIVTGIVALIMMFKPNLDLSFIFKLSPLIFVFLGVEILYNYFAYKGQKLKYDLLSGFVCFVLIIAGGCLSAVPYVWNYFGPPAMQVRDELNSQIRGRISESLVDERSLIRQMYLNVGLPYYKQYTLDMSYNELSEDARVYLHFNLNGPYSDKEAFAADCQKILSKLDALNLDIRNLNIRYDGDEADFDLELYDRFHLNLDRENLLRRIDETRYEEDEDTKEDALPAVEELPDEDSTSPLGLSESEGFIDE